MSFVRVRWSLQAFFSNNAIKMCVKHVAYAALEPMLSCEVHGDSGTELNNTACELHEEVPQPDSSHVRLTEASNILKNVYKRLRQGVAKRSCTERGRALCLRLGMSASSWHGWAELHVNPCIAIGYFMSSMALALGAIVSLCTGVRGEGHMYFVVLVPLGFEAVVGSAVAALFWRWGPVVAHHKLYQPVPAFLALCAMPVCYVAFLGPEATVPWHNSFYSLILLSALVFAMIQVAGAGLVPGEHPAEPRVSIREPVVRAALLALMMLDAFSDLALTRSFLNAVCSHCLF